MSQQQQDDTNEIVNLANQDAKTRKNLQQQGDAKPKPSYRGTSLVSPPLYVPLPPLT